LARSGNAVSDVRNAVSGVRNPDRGVRNADRGISNVDRGISNADRGISNADAGISNADAGISTADAGISIADRAVDTSNFYTRIAGRIDDTSDGAARSPKVAIRRQKPVRRRAECAIRSSEGMSSTPVVVARH
jgi:hypothetical protein